MRSRSDKQPSAWFDSLLFYLLMALAAALIGWLNSHYYVAWDWSDQARNSLSPPSQRLLTKLEAPLRITSFAPENPALRRQVREVVERYQRYQPDIELEFIDPARHPSLTRELGIRVSGELRLEYQGRSEHLQRIDEQRLSNAIQRLISQGERWVVGLEGHGERRLSGQSNHDLGAFGTQLERKGYRVQALDLSTSPEIPDNTGLLVIASPQVSYLRGEVKRIVDYVARGGNLLWLTDPGDPPGLEALAEQIGVQVLPGTVVDANAADLGLDDPAIAVVPRYPDHSATRQFELITLYPEAAALAITETTDWSSTPLLKTLSRTWNETGPIHGKVSRDPDRGEQAGPLNIGVALVRILDSAQQRVLVAGDGDFLSNAYLGNGGNLDLGMALVRWLTHDDHLIDIPTRTTRDLELNLSPLTGAVIGLGFLFGLPVLLALSGLLIWWRRRRL